MMIYHQDRKHQTGVAIVLAMGVVAMTAIIAMAMLFTQNTWARHRELSVERAQALQVVKAGIDWGRAVLGDDRRISSVDHLGEPWALRLPPMTIENGKMAGHLEDQNGRLNLNNLVRNGQVNATQLEYFQRLLSVLGLPGSLARTLVDWLDADRDTTPQGGAEDDYYMTLSPPYLSANRPLTDIADLALVRGFDERVRARLAPFVTALPRHTAVNINTAPAEVIAAIVENLPLHEARAVVARRDRAYARNPADFRLLLPGGAKFAENDVTVSSDYFVARVQVTIGGADASGAALLVRQGSGWPSVIWRKSL